MTPYWLTANDFDSFWWVKIYTIFFCCSGWGTAVRFTAVGGRRWARLSIPVLLGANILEAVAVDALSGGWAHGMVAVAGLILVGTIPMGPGAIKIDPPERHTDFRLSLTRGWVVAYTAWNWAFVYLNYPTYVGYHTAVLAAALILGLADPERWLQARTCTLDLNLLAMATVNAELVAWMDTSHWHDDRATVVVAGVAFAATAAGTVRRFRRTIDRKSPVGRRLHPNRIAPRKNDP